MPTYSEVYNLFFDDTNTQVDANIHRHIILDTRPSWRSTWVGFLFSKDSSLSVVLSPRSSFLASLTVGKPAFLGFTFFLEGVSFHSFRLESADLCSSIVRNFQSCFSFALGLAHGCSSARCRFCSSCLLRALLSPDSHFFVQCSIEIHSFAQYLECAATATPFNALTVEADDDTHFPEFLDLVVSPSQ